MDPKDWFPNCEECNKKQLEKELGE